MPETLEPQPVASPPVASPPAAPRAAAPSDRVSPTVSTAPPVAVSPVTVSPVAAPTVAASADPALQAQTSAALAAALAALRAAAAPVVPLAPVTAGVAAPDAPTDPASCTTAALAGADADADADADPRALLALARAVSACTDFDGAAATVCSRLALSLGASRVVLGWRRRGRAPSRPLAMSGAGEPQWDGETTRRLSAALDEGVDQARALACPGGEGARAVLRAHDGLRRAHGMAAVLSAPIAHDGHPFGGLLAEFEAAPPPGTLERLSAAAVLVAPWLSGLHARRPGALVRTLATLGVLRSAAQPAAGRRRWPWVVVLLAACGGLAVPIDASVSAPARIEGEVQRTVAAPIRGYLKAVRVRPGDAVREGDVLAELGDRDLDLERAKLRSEFAQHAAAQTAAMARGDRTAMAVAQSRRDEVGARLGLIEHQLEQIRVRAPIDGVVLQGDLAQKVGAPVDRGHELFVVAPVSRHRVIVELDERDLRRVVEGQAGRLALSALPWDALPVRVERIAPAAVARDGRNLFELEAVLLAPADGLRPGQRGVAQLEAGQAPLAVQWGRRIADAVARLAWRWLP